MYGVPLLNSNVSNAVAVVTEVEKPHTIYIYSRFYRLKPQREFGNLFSKDNGCLHPYAGLGNIESVKDLMTQTFLVNDFKCSKFGLHTHRMLGWVYN